MLKVFEPEPLYKADSRNEPMIWKIHVLQFADRAEIICEYGKLNGKMQKSRDLITEGKNQGKANETTFTEQAISEAQAKWKKQQERKGYVDDLRLIHKDQRQGAEPMLAHRYDKYPDKITLPCYIQPKLDGHRCIAVIEGGSASLFSRQRKPITGLPHIVEALESLGIDDAVFDGELYNHDFHNDFESLTGFIRSESPKEGHEVVQYHIYDVVDHHAPFSERNKEVQDRIPEEHPTLKRVDTFFVLDDADLMDMHKKFRAAQYEGSILRNADGKYVGKRSYDLQKVKEFVDAEFQIVDVEEGRGKMAGCAIFVCVTEEEKTFHAKMKGSLENLARLYEQREQLKGRTVTVQFQEYTKEGIPRFPVALRLREDV